MIITGLEFEDHKITSYLFTLGNKKILFDFGIKELEEELIDSLDYIFISHYHYDHSCGLLENIEKIPSKCKVYMTRTTKEVFEYIIQNRKLKESQEKKMLDKLSCLFNIALFNKDYEEDSLKFKFYRSGHCFGGFMLYICDENESIFISSDMDYVSSDIDRQYYVEERIDANFAILDGTITDDEDFKKSKLNSLRINKNKDDHFYCKIEKAVFIAKVLSDKYPDANIIYDFDLEPLITIFYKNGYDCFSKNYNIHTKSLEYLFDSEKKNENKHKIYLSSIYNNQTFQPDTLFSLHIGNYDRKEFIDNNLSNKTKILLGHYNKTDKIYEYCKMNNYEPIKKGTYKYEKK